MAYPKIEGHRDGIIRENTGEAYSGQRRGLWAETQCQQKFCSVYKRDKLFVAINWKRCTTWNGLFGHTLAEATNNLQIMKALV